MSVNLDLPIADENIRLLGAPCWGCLRTHQVLRRPSLHRPLQIPRTWTKECNESLQFPEENPGAQGPRILSLKPSKEAEMKPSLGMPRLCLPCSFLGLQPLRVTLVPDISAWRDMPRTKTSDICLCPSPLPLEMPDSPPAQQTTNAQ